MIERLAKKIERVAGGGGIQAIKNKAIEVEQTGKKVIRMETGLPDFDTPAYIKKAAIESLERGDVFYMPALGLKSLREEISKKLKRDNQLDYGIDEIMIVSGLAEGVFDALNAILDEGDEILLPDPIWPNYIDVAHLAGAKVVPFVLKEENDFQIDMEELYSKVTEKTKAIVLISPNNPTGSVLTKETFKKIADFAIEKNLFVVSDEIYERIVYDGEEPFSIGSLPGMRERTITLNGFSKAYSMTGWRLGYVAADRPIIQAMNKIHQQNTANSVSFGQYGALAALTGKEETEEVGKMVAEYKRRRDYIVEHLNAIDGVSCAVPKGAFYMWINIKELPMTSTEFAYYLLEEEGVALVPGPVFGEHSEGYLRMSFATAYDEIVEACERIKRAVEKLQNR